MNSGDFKQGKNQKQRLFRFLLRSLLGNNMCVLCHCDSGSPRELICPVCMEDLERFALGTDILLNKPNSAVKLQSDKLSGLAVVAPYQWPFSQCIASLKFHQGCLHAQWFGELLQQQVSHQLWPEPDLLIPLPLHPIREWQRGYNQAKLIANHMPIYRDRLADSLLSRVKMTKPQSELGQSERKQNVHNAFSCRTEVKGKRVLLVDDVITTGHSVNQAAGAVLDAGATAVYVAAVALREMD